MAATNINRVVITGNLTRDPELRTTNSGLHVCSLRIASNTRRKGQDGNWEDKANYFDVTVFGAQGENCSRFLSKGRPICVDGRLEYREWTDKETQAKRNAVEIVADSVQFLGGRDDNANGGGQSYGASAPQQNSTFSPPQSDVPANTQDFQPVGAIGGGDQHEDDIPF